MKKVTLCLDTRTAGVFQLVADRLEHPLELILTRLLQGEAGYIITVGSIPELAEKMTQEIVANWDDTHGEDLLEDLLKEQKECIYT